MANAWDAEGSIIHGTLVLSLLLLAITLGGLVVHNLLLEVRLALST